MAEALGRVAPGLVALGTGLVLAVAEGGFAPADWYPAGIFLGVLVVVALAFGPAVGRLGLAGWALGTWAAFTIWGYLTILWAEDQGAAWDAANRSLLYGLVLAVVLLRPWARPAAAVAVGLAAFGTALMAAIVLVRSGGADATGFVAGRLNDPLGYANATANLWLIGLWPALGLATWRELPWFVRGPALGAGSVLLSTAVLSQSRGAAVAVALAAVVWIVVTPRRVPALLALAAVAGAAAIEWSTLVAVRDSVDSAQLGSRFADAREAIALGAIVVAVAGSLAALAGRWTPAAVRTRRARRGGDAAIALLALAAVVAALVAVGSPGDWIHDRWDDFKTSGYSQVEQGSTRFGGSLGSGRYDYWRVSWNEFRDHPLGGLGGDNFQAAYLEHRAIDEAPVHPHSLAFRLLAETGIVGTVLFLAFLGLCLVMVVRGRRRAGDPEGVLAAAALGGFAVWFWHAQADWLFEFPALVIVAFALLGVAARTTAAEAPAPAREGFAPRLPRRVLKALGAVVGIAAVVSLAVPGYAARLSRDALQDAGLSTAERIDRLGRAADANRLAFEPLLSRAILERRAGEPTFARRDLERARARNRANWFVAFELAMLDAQPGGDRTEALRLLDETARRNPRQEVVRQVRRAVSAGRRVNPDRVEERLQAQLQSKLARVDTTR